MAFSVGQRVVCISKDPWHNGVRDADFAVPVYRGTYTIREIETDHDGTGLRFEEIRNPVVTWNGGKVSEPRFMPIAFRPVRTTDTGMSKLKSLLLPKTKKARSKERA